MNTENPAQSSRLTRWLAIFVCCVVVYVLSSGPVLGLAFWLREATGWDGFYAVLWLYYPLLALGHGSPLMKYVEWWVVDVFHTVGPG